MTMVLAKWRGVTSGHLSGLGAFLILPLALLAPMALSLIAIFGMVVIPALLFRRDGRLPRFSLALGLPLGVFIAYAGVSALWAMDLGNALGVASRLGLLFLGGLALLDASRRLDPEDRRRAALGLMIGLAVGVALLAVEVADHGAITESLRTLFGARFKASSILFNRGATVLAILIWCGVLLALRRRRFWLAGAILAVTLGIVSMTEAAAAPVGMLAGIVAFGLVIAAPRRMPAIFGVGLAIVILVAPFVVYFAHGVPALAGFWTLPNSDGHRLRIWSHAVGLIAQKPWLGWGMDAARSLGTEGHGMGPAADLMPLHPHNGVLQIWLELGFVGAALAAWFAFALCRAIAKGMPAPLDRATAFAMLASALVVLGVSYGIWQWWWQSTLWLTATLMAGLPRADAPPPKGVPKSASKSANGGP